MRPPGQSKRKYWGGWRPTGADRQWTSGGSKSSAASNQGPPLPLGGLCLPVNGAGGRYSGYPNSVPRNWSRSDAFIVPARTRSPLRAFMHFCPPLFSAILGLLLLSRTAGAQQTDTTRTDSTQVTQLETIEVTSSIAPTAGPTIGSGIPARISTVTGEAIDAWEPRLLADALASQPGISLYDDLGSPFKLNLSSRGFNVGPVVGLPPGISVFLDGVRQNEPDAAEVNFDLLPMEHVQRVELLSGSGSLL